MYGHPRDIYWNLLDIPIGISKISAGICYMSVGSRDFLRSNRCLPKSQRYLLECVKDLFELKRYLPEPNRYLLEYPFESSRYLVGGRMSQYMGAFTAAGEIVSCKVVQAKLLMDAYLYVMGDSLCDVAVERKKDWGSVR